MANQNTQKPRIVYSTAEKPVFLESLIGKKKINLYEKRHLELDGKSVKIVVDGIVDGDKEIQAELKNAGLQNILKLQTMRYGTLENAIARANDRGIYCNVANIPESIGERAEWVNNARSELELLKSEYGLTDADLKNITVEGLAAIINKKNNPTPQATPQTTPQTTEGDAK